MLMPYQAQKNNILLRRFWRYLKKRPQNVAEKSTISPALGIHDTARTVPVLYNSIVLEFLL
jgi:hypothetical protein